MAGRDLLLSPAAAAAAQPAIRPRGAWGDGLAPTGPLPSESAGDVRFLLVHHTAGANGYPADAVRATIRGIFDYHTGPKGWNDVAYNFFVDAYGVIWEGRQGSLAGPVKGDATGGSQGFAQLCCFLGDHRTVPPTPKALAAMADLLAWLAGRYAIDLSATAKATFVSRGSNRHPSGKQVTTPTIAAHRDMSNTTCPGDACYALVRGDLSRTAAAKAGATVPTTVAAASSPPGPAPPPNPATTAGAPEPAAPSSTLPAASPTQVAEDNPLPPPTTVIPLPVEIAGGRGAAARPSSTSRVLSLGGVGAAGAAVTAAVFVRRRRRANAESRWYTSELLNPPGGPVAAPEPDQAPPGPLPPHQA